MKIAYCGYDFFHACLHELIANEFEIGRVFTVDCDNQYNFNQYIYEICDQHNIPVTDKPITKDDVEQLKVEGFDLLISAAYYYKIPGLSAYGINGINIHPTLLPLGRGVWPLPWTILTDQQSSGVSIHKLSPEFDAGDILTQESFPLTAYENLESLSAKVQLLGKRLLIEVVKDFDRYWNNAHAQPANAVYWPRPKKEHRTLDWNKSVTELDRICRAFGKFGCFATFDNKKWIVYSINAWRENHHYRVGEVIHKTNTEMIVAASDGLVSLLYFQQKKQD